MVLKKRKKVAIMEEPPSDIFHYLIICSFSGGRWNGSLENHEARKVQFLDYVATVSY